MDHERLQPSRRQVFDLAARQNGVVARRQLIELGLSSDAITHRVRNGRLHPVLRGIYALGRPGISGHGRWMAAILRCGPEAVLSHRSAGALWRIAKDSPAQIDVSLPAHRARTARGIVVHRRAELRPGDVTVECGIPVTAPTCTFVDLAHRLPPSQLEAAISEADKLGLIDPEALRSALPDYSGRRGVGALRRTLDAARSS